MPLLSKVVLTLPLLNGTKTIIKVNYGKTSRENSLKEAMKTKMMNDSIDSHYISI